MKVKDAIQIMSYMDPDDILVVRNGQGGVGGTKCTKVKSFNQGIDWDSGKIFIETNEKLREETDFDRIAAKLLYRLMDNKAFESIMVRSGEPINKRSQTIMLKEACETAIAEVEALRRNNS